MAFKLNCAKSQVSNGANNITAKQQNLSHLNRIGAKQKLRQPNNQEPCQPITKTKCSKQRLTANFTNTQNIRKSNFATQSSANIKLTTMEKSKFTNRSITPVSTNLITTNKFQNSKINSNEQSTRLTKSARSTSAIKSSPLSTPWKSPFKTFITTGIHRTRSQYGCQSQQFSYDLSPDELKFVNTLKSPMKPAPEQERQLLVNGQRMEYLTQRYEHSPYCKYNYPEATSWRIGWLQQHSTKLKN